MFKTWMFIFILSYCVSVSADPIPCPSPTQIATIGVKFTYYDPTSYTWWYEADNSYDTNYLWHVNFFVGGKDKNDADREMEKYIQTLFLVSSTKFPDIYSCVYGSAERMTAATATTPNSR